VDSLQPHLRRLVPYHYRRSHPRVAHPRRLRHDRVIAERLINRVHVNNTLIASFLFIWGLRLESLVQLTSYCHAWQEVACLLDRLPSDSGLYPCFVPNSGRILGCGSSWGLGISKLWKIYDFALVCQDGVELVLRIVSSTLYVIRWVESIEGRFLHTIIHRVLKLLPSCTYRGISIPWCLYGGSPLAVFLFLNLIHLFGIRNNRLKILLDSFLGSNLFFVNVLISYEESLPPWVFWKLRLQIVHIDFFDFFVMQPWHFNNLLQIFNLLSHLIIGDIKLFPDLFT